MMKHFPPEQCVWGKIVLFNNVEFMSWENYLSDVSLLLPEKCSSSLHEELLNSLAVVSRQ